MSLPVQHHQQKIIYSMCVSVISLHHQFVHCGESLLVCMGGDLATYDRIYVQQAVVALRPPNSPANQVVMAAILFHSEIEKSNIELDFQVNPA